MSRLHFGLERHTALRETDVMHLNSRAIAHDPRRYSDPESFNPDRFFNANGELNQDDVSYVFGFGRR